MKLIIRSTKFSSTQQGCNLLYVMATHMHMKTAFCISLNTSHMRTHINLHIPCKVTYQSFMEWNESKLHLSDRFSCRHHMPRSSKFIL